MDHVFQGNKPDSDEEQWASNDTFTKAWNEWEKHLLPHPDEHNELADISGQWLPDAQSDTDSQLPSGLNLYSTMETNAPVVHEEEYSRQAEDSWCDMSLSHPVTDQPPNTALITTEQPTSLLTRHRPLSSSTSSSSWQTDSLVSSRIPSAETDGSWVNIQPYPSSVRSNVAHEQHIHNIRAETGPLIVTESSAQSTSFLDPQFDCTTMFPNCFTGGQSSIESLVCPERSPAAARGPMSSPNITLPQKGKKRAYTEAGSAKVKRTRESGACIRCRMLKESCDEGNPCGACVRVSQTARFFRGPCYRADLKDVVPFRQGNSRYGMTESKLFKYHWSSGDTTERLVDLVYAFDNHEPTTVSKLSIRCRKFIVRKEIVMDPLPTTRGGVVVVENPHFAWYDADKPEAKANITSFLTALIPSLLEDVALKITDDLTRLVFNEARRFSQRSQGSILTKVLNIQAIMHFSKRRLVLDGPNVLDMDYFDNEDLKRQGRVPLPGVIDYQVDTLCIIYMQDQMKEVSRWMNRVLFKKPGFAAWYEVFLVCFLFLDCLEQVHNAQWYHMLSRFKGHNNSNVLSQASNVTRHMIGGWEQSAKILIYHFRSVLRGHVPFTGPWDEDKREEIRRKKPDMDREAWNMIEKLLVILEPRQDEIRARSSEDLDGSTAKPLIWISRLFVDSDIGVAV